MSQQYHCDRGNVNSTGNLISAETAEQPLHLIFKSTESGTAELTGDIGDVVFDEVGDFIGGGLVDPGLFNELLDHFFHVRESTGLGYSDEDFTCCNASSKRSATPK